MHATAALAFEHSRRSSRFGTPGIALALGILFLGMSGCAKGEGSADSAAAGGRSAPNDTGGMSGMSGMKGMPSSDSGAMGGMGGTMGMMGGMRQQMDDMMKADPARMKAMLPAHRQMAANMLSQMGSEMRSMNMATDAAWSALVDSVRQDLTRQPDLSAQQLRDVVPGHHARLTRLMQMHGDMMKRMEK